MRFYLVKFNTDLMVDLMVEEQAIVLALDPVHAIKKVEEMLAREWQELDRCPEFESVECKSFEGMVIN